MARSDDLYQLPADLPVPVDDGACRHLRGADVPACALMSTRGEAVSVRAASERARVVVFAYPRTGRPDRDPPAGWNQIPGARGCTPQACGFRDLHPELTSLGVEVYGLSTQDPAYQAEAAARLHLPFALLSDERLELTTAMRLPTFAVDGMTLLKRFTLIVWRGRVEHVFYPVFPSDRSAATVAAWLRAGAST